MTLAQHLKNYPAHLGLYLIGALDFFSRLPAAGSLAPYAQYIGYAGVAAAALHHAYDSGATNAVAQKVVEAPAKLMLAVMMLGSLSAGLVGCATVPTQTEQTATAAAVTVATGIAIQQKDTDPQVWQKRAKEIKLIALELQAVNNAGNATLATLAADLQPQIAKLGPADVLAVNALVATLQPVLNQQIANNPKVGNTQVAVANIITAVLTACAAYGA